jgi:gamma-glutamyltranspeptidase/glutathione hydrolase
VIPPILRPDAGGRSSVYGTTGAVACEHPRAALVGIRTLDAGGTAADACVAMGATMAVLSPMMTGLGGDAVALFYDAGARRVHGLAGWGRAGAGASIEALRERGHEAIPLAGGATVTVPGAVRLWEDLAREHGRLPLSHLLEPARDIAERGFPVSHVVARLWNDALELLQGSATARATFLPNGRAPRPGQLFRQPELARTLARVAQEGADALYHGEVAESIAGAVRQAGGFLEAEDLAGHVTTRAEPLSTTYRGLTVHEMPPPSQGIVALEILNVLEHFDLAALGPLSAQRIHLEAEATKLAFEDALAHVGDGGAEVEWMVGDERATELAGRIDAGRARATAGAASAGGDTTYLCAVDAEGNGCSFINSLFKAFGSGIVAPGTGVCLHNRGRGFRLEPDHPAALGPGRRPFHTIIPALVTREGGLWATLGVMGAHMQPQGHAQVLANLHDFGMDPQEAIDHPRHFSTEEGRLVVESRVPEAERRRLEALGHDVETAEAYAIPTGSGQLIRVHEDGVRECGSDPRRDGCALAQ